MMGGYGSGRHGGIGAKTTTDDCHSIDIRHWSREGLLVPGRSFTLEWSRRGRVTSAINVQSERGRVILSYRNRRFGGEWQVMRYPVYLEWTGCNFGGKRPWFLCPADGCGHRVAILHGGTIFACRYCHQLAYPSQRESGDHRGIRRADRIREKLGWEPGVLNGIGWKPKGMHWKTFSRLTAEHQRIVSKSLTGMADQFDFLDEWQDERK